MGPVDYNSLHHAMVFFERLKENDKRREAFYSCLEQRGKVCLRGNAQNNACEFILFFVSDHSELWELIEKDPGIQSGYCRLTDAYPVLLTATRQTASPSAIK